MKRAFSAGLFSIWVTPACTEAWYSFSGAGQYAACWTSSKYYQPKKGYLLFCGFWFEFFLKSGIKWNQAGYLISYNMKFCEYVQQRGGQISELSKKMWSLRLWYLCRLLFKQTAFQTWLKTYTTWKCYFAIKKSLQSSFSFSSVECLWHKKDYTSFPDCYKAMTN